MKSAKVGESYQTLHGSHFAYCMANPGQLRKGISVMGLFGFLGLGGSGPSAAEAQEMVKNGALLLDVRTPDEFASGHVSGAKNIPVQQLASRLKELPPKGKSIVVYCRSGGRSASASSILRQAGYEVHDLGAMSNWYS